MKRSILIPILVVSTLAVLAGASIGLYYTFTPTADSELVIVNATAIEQTDTVTVTLTCEGDQTQTQAGNNNKYQRKYAYMHQIQIKNGPDGEVLYQEQYQHQWRHRIQAGNTFMYQYQVEGLESGQMLQIRIEYNNGKVATHTFTV